MLTELFTSRTRINLFLKLFLNPGISCYLRELAREFNLTPNALKEELDNLSRAGYLGKEQRGQSIFYKANTNHPFFPEINSIVKKYYGIDKIVEQILNDLGKVEAIYALDDYAEGRDSGLIDVLIVGDVDMDKIQGLRPSLEKEIKRKICEELMGLELKAGTSHIFENMLKCYNTFIKSGLIDKRELALLDDWISDCKTTLLHLLGASSGIFLG